MSEESPETPEESKKYTLARRRIRRFFYRPKRYKPEDDERAENGFWLTKRQARIGYRWSLMHMANGCPHGDKDAYAGAIGGRFSYTFTPTSIGTLISVNCCCGRGLLLNGDDL